MGLEKLLDKQAAARKLYETPHTCEEVAGRTERRKKILCGMPAPNCDPNFTPAQWFCDHHWNDVPGDNEYIDEDDIEEEEDNQQGETLIACAACNKTENLKQCPMCKQVFCLDHLTAFKHVSEEVGKHSSKVMCEKTA